MPRSTFHSQYASQVGYSDTRYIVVMLAAAAAADGLTFSSFLSRNRIRSIAH